jgi:branched-chain amino acid transport system permease protein
MGVRSNAGALIAGMTYTLFPAVLQVYVDPVWNPLPIILFGLGAIYTARNPDGWIPELGRQFFWVAERAIRLFRHGGGPTETTRAPSTSTSTSTKSSAPHGVGHSALTETERV